jgi:hypothetical protein
MRRTFPDFCKTVGTLEQRAQTLKIRWVMLAMQAVVVLSRDRLALGSKALGSAAYMWVLLRMGSCNCLASLSVCCHFFKYSLNIALRSAQVPCTSGC